MGLILFGAIAGFFVPILHCRWCSREYESIADWAVATAKAHPEMRDEAQANVRALKCYRCGNRPRLSRQ